MKPPLNHFAQGLKILKSVFVLFRGLIQLFLPIISQNLSKTQNSINKDYVAVHGFRGQSPTVMSGTVDICWLELISMTAFPKN